MQLSQVTTLRAQKFTLLNDWYGSFPFFSRGGTIHINLAHAFPSDPATFPHPSASHGDHGGVSGYCGTGIFVAKGTCRYRCRSPREYGILGRVAFVLIHHDALNGRMVFNVFCPDVVPIVRGGDNIDGTQNTLIFDSDTVLLSECMVLSERKKNNNMHPKSLLR